MIFTSQIDESGLTITAHPENEAEWHGFRFEGPYPAIQLVNPEVRFEYPIQSIHPDLLGLLCMLAFFPYCKDKITFPQPVSSAFEYAFSRAILSPHEVIEGVFKVSGRFYIQNVDATVKRYSGSKLSISFGGGIDSMAAHVMFPEAILIHELSRDRQGNVIPDNSTSYIKEIQEQGREAYSIINNCRRGISHPSGWSTWASSVENSVLLATDLNIGYIMTGTTSDTLFLRNGISFREAPSPERVNPWNRVFNHLGLQLFSPVWNMTEAGTMKICNDAGVLKKSVSCQNKDGGECHECFKCFRKDTLAHALGFTFYDNSHWEKYKTKKIKKNHNAQPLYFAHIFRFSLPKLSHIAWLRGIVDQFPDTSPFLIHYYEPGINLVPDELQIQLRERINQYLEPLEDEMSLVNWKQTPRKERNIEYFTRIIKLFKKF